MTPTTAAPETLCLDADHPGQRCPFEAECPEQRRRMMHYQALDKKRLCWKFLERAGTERPASKAGQVPAGMTRRAEPPVSDPTDEIKLQPMPLARPA